MIKAKYYSWMRLLLLPVLLFLSLSGFGADNDFPAQPNPPRLVNDFAHFLNGSEQQQLEQKLLHYYDSTSTEIAVVTLQSIGSYEISDYAVTLFRKWGIGGRKKNNGLLILVAKEQRKIWMTTGYGMEGVLTDGMLGQIIRDEMEPNFKRGDFFLAFDKATDAIFQAAAGEYQADPKNKEGKSQRSGPGTIIIIVIIFLIIVASSRRGGGGGGGGLLNSAGWIAASMLNNRHRSSGWGDSGGWGGGWGGGSGDSGGFGGFGGGSSGGGGAGGGW